ncbi:glycoside hydrolase family 43 protein [Alkalihalobacillus sp. MEB130]|uniref:glycoside hydrolase family 43 protein n=1 Tax=Alkalihalobacillus sp. MEB130 TaxID=2976704 RepID=UPI0028DE4C62|nr:glycoside hydrolase family 43 protein [Alkalihalobacillus sp. MEB130]MDT8862170.1 glycoside hydrolase family 43 protein [Alkalihalobacillus sp. MEB130]
MKYLNPVIPGFYPDPSVVKVGESDFYLVTSSFEYFPGIPIFHSKDLLHWEQIGSVLTRESQFNLEVSRSSGGVFAPTIRYQDGLFYVIVTDVTGIGNFFVTAEEPTGPWSDPISIPYGNIDPSLMFDEDGTVYVSIQNGEGKESHIIQYEIDCKTGEALTDPVVIFEGDGGQWTEAPHLYKINGMYYLLCACGGTGEDHRAIIARSAKPYGPYELLECPILTHNKLPEHPIQNIGHADFVEDVNNQWWAVFLGTRPVHQRYTILGRETFLAPVNWTEDGWPVIDQNEGHVSEIMNSKRLLEGSNMKEHVVNFDDFNEDMLAKSWFHLRKKKDESYSLIERKGWLRLFGTADHLHTENGVPTLLCKPQQHVRMEFSSMLGFSPAQDGEEAGLVARLHEDAHYEIGVKRINGETIIFASVTIQGETKEIGRNSFHSSNIHLRIRSDEEQYYFDFAQTEDEWKTLGTSPIKYLSKEENGGYGKVFTGVCLGLYATGNGKESLSPAYFDWVNYTGITSLIN